MLAGGLLAGGYVFRVLGPGAGAAHEPSPCARRVARGARWWRWRWRCARCCWASCRCDPSSLLQIGRPLRDGALCNERRRHAGVPRLLVATLAPPLVLLLACLSRRLREHACRRCWRWRRCPRLAAALLALGGTALVARPAAARSVTPGARRAGAMLLGVAALLWIAAGVYAVADCAASRRRALRRLVAADADRQPRRLHRRRPGGLLSVLRPGQPAGLRADRA